MAECTFQVSTQKLEPDSCCWNQKIRHSRAGLPHVLLRIEHQLENHLANPFSYMFFVPLCTPKCFFKNMRHANYLFAKELQVDVHLTYCMVFTKNIQFGCQCHSYLVFGYVVHLSFNFEHFQNSLGFLKWIMY